jgi:hypothetical protein
MRQSSLLEKRSKAVSDFRAAFEKLLAHHQMIMEEYGGYGNLRVGDRNIRERERALRQEVGRLAGGAGRATADAGLSYALIGFEFNPIANWPRAIEGGLRTGDVLAFCDTAIGRFDQQAEEAREREGGLVGLLARFWRFPTDVREAAGLESPGVRRVAFWGSVAAQVAATLVVTALLGGLSLLVARLL